MESTFSEDQGKLLDAIQASKGTQAFKLIDDREVLVYQGQVIAEAKPKNRGNLSSVDVESLSSLAVLLTERPNCVVKVKSPHSVSVVDVTEPEKHQWIFTAAAQLPAIGVLYGYVPLDQALIELRQFFEQSDMTQRITEQLSKVKLEDITEIEDDGMGVDVTVRSRVQGRDKDATAFNIELTPFRTFPELFETGEPDVEPDVVPGTFTMRWKKDDKNVKVFLAEQGNLKWRYAQMNKVAEYLRILLPESVIVV